MDSPSGQVLQQRIDLTAGTAGSVAVSPDGSKLYIGVGSFQLLVYDLGSGTEVGSSTMNIGGSGGNLVATSGGVWGTIGVGMSEWVWFAPDGNLRFAHRESTGAGAGFDSLPSYSGGVVWIGGSHTLECVNPANGQTLATATIPTDNGVVEYFGSPTVTNGHAYAYYQDSSSQQMGLARMTPCGQACGQAQPQWLPKPFASSSSTAPEHRYPPDPGRARTDRFPYVSAIQPDGSSIPAAPSKASPRPDHHPTGPAHLFTDPALGRSPRNDHRAMVGRLDPAIPVRLTQTGGNSLSEIGSNSPSRIRYGFDPNPAPKRFGPRRFETAAHIAKERSQSPEKMLSQSGRQQQAKPVRMAANRETDTKAETRHHRIEYSNPRIP